MSNKNSTTVVKSDLESVIVNARYHISDGNKKLVPNKDVAFLVWNIPAVSTCPFRTRLCGGFLKGEKKVTDEKGHPICYALKAETAYKQVLPARKDNLKMSLLPSFVDDMTGIILDKARRTRKPRLIVRIHESGDFYNQVYADNWLQIMRNCECESKITFIAYTKPFTISKIFFCNKTS